MSASHEIQSIREVSRQLVREWGLLSGFEGRASVTQCHTLIEIEKQERTVAELAELLNMDKSNASRTLTALEEKGWVARVVLNVDRRRKPMRITAKGRQVVGKLHQHANQQVEDALRLVSPDERAVILEGMKRYEKALGRARAQKGVLYRAAEPEDNLALSDIITASIKELAGCGPGSGIEDAEINDMSGSYADEDCLYLVAERDGGILGGGGLRPLKKGEAGTCELQRMYLQPDLRGLGLGASILNRLLEFAVSRGFKICYLETMADASAARKLYERFGFQQIEDRCGETGHSTCNTFYSKLLKAD